MGYSILNEISDSGGFIATGMLSHKVHGRSLVVTWSTEMDAAEFLASCQQMAYEPGILSKIEIIADGEFIDEFQTMGDLAKLLTGRSLVRFNVNGWSLTWVRSMFGGLHEIEAVLSSQPKEIAEMVATSLSGVHVGVVPDLLSAANEALAA